MLNSMQTNQTIAWLTKEYKAKSFSLERLFGVGSIKAESVTPNTEKKKKE